MQPNLILAETNTDKLYQLNSFLKRLTSDVDWEAFRPVLSVLRKPQGGTLVDGTFVEVPRQHNTKEENEQIKNGEVPKSFEANKHKLAQKDCDASWTKKRDENHFGYKDHPWVDSLWKLIWDYGVTTAKVHDSVPYLDVLPEKPNEGCEKSYADSAYSGKAIAAELLNRGYEALICEKGYRNHSLSEEQKESTRLKSKVRCRIEHVFGEQKMRMKDETLRSIGFARAKFWIGIRNLGSNISRHLTLQKLGRVN